MENRFLEPRGQLVATRPRTAVGHNGQAASGFAAAQSWATPFAATDRVLVILIENGGVDLGIPEVVDKLLSAIPGSDLIPDRYRHELVSYIRDRIKAVTDNLLETLELTLNRYTDATPDLYGSVVVLRDGTASYADLKSQLIALSKNAKIIDLFILTHGMKDLISFAGDIDSRKIRAMRTEAGQPLTIRSVYMMNCVGSSLNQAWIDAGAKVSSGSTGNNYLPEPTMYFFWSNWKSGQTFGNAVTGAYHKTISVMNDAIKGFLRGLPIPGTDAAAAAVDVAKLDFVRESSPLIQGEQTMAISTDSPSFSQTVTPPSSLATTVLSLSVIRQLSSESEPPAASGTPQRSLSAAGMNLIKEFEAFRARMYNDPVGHCTIGYGTLLHLGNCDGRATEQPYTNGATEAQATDLLMEHANEVQAVINSSVSVPLNQNQNDALVSFAYNVGSANFGKSTLLRVLNDGNYAAVPSELRKWTKARQKGQLIELPGLVKRRDAEAKLFERPVQSTDAGVAQSLSVDATHAYAFTDANSPQSEQSLEVRRRVARSTGLAEAGGRFDLVHDDSNRINFGLGSWTGSRIADVLDTYEQFAQNAGTTNVLYGYFGGEDAFNNLRQRFRTNGTATTLTAAERQELQQLGADTTMQDAQIQHLANDVKADLDAIGNTGNPWYPFIDGGMGAITELAAHVLVHARHQAGSLSGVLKDAIDHFGGDDALGKAMVAGTVTEQQFLTQVGEQIATRVKPALQNGVRKRYQTLFTNHANSDLSYYFSPAN
jgi:GH24 family phage-related lysozyme (muramidase)